MFSYNVPEPAPTQSCTIVVFSVVTPYAFVSMFCFSFANCGWPGSQLDHICSAPFTGPIWTPMIEKVPFCVPSMCTESGHGGGVPLVAFLLHCQLYHTSGPLASGAHIFEGRSQHWHLQRSDVHTAFDFQVVPADTLVQGW